MTSREVGELLKGGIGKTFKVTAPGEGTFYGNLCHLIYDRDHPKTAQFVDVESKDGRIRGNIPVESIQAIEESDGSTKPVELHRWEALILIRAISSLSDERETHALKGLSNDLQKIADDLGGKP